MEKIFIKEALRRSKGRRSSAAEMLKIAERTLYRKMNQHKIKKNGEKSTNRVRSYALSKNGK